tara:strand:+ start:1990 stop:2415 length:426 start_codon:yes stop_codon:yes gene_type:complete
MKKHEIILSILLSIVIILVFLNSFKQQKEVCINEKCFQVEIAKTSEEKAKGLMFRENLDENKGMLFIFEKQGIRSFWMKNTLIPLDIIWINKNKEIVSIKKNAQPCDIICNSIIPDSEALYVLEVNAGQANNFFIGDKVEI